MVLFFLDETTIISYWRLLMSKFYTALSAIATTTICAAALVNIGSIFVPNVVSTEMNIAQKAMVAQKTVNEMAFYTVTTVITQNQSQFAQASMAGIFSFTILSCESGVLLLALLILSKKYA
jgi:hypothetical protein